MNQRSVLACLVLAVVVGCGKHGVVDAVMSGAYRPEGQGAVDVSPYVLLAGDLHCHVSPPDHPRHVGRSFPDTVALAEEEGLDFVVLSPHLWDGFFAEEELRAEALAGHDLLARAIEETETDVLFVPGFEYSTGLGHATLAFADLPAVLDEVPTDVAAERPELFFERWAARGGLIVVNHPMLTPVDSVIPNAQWDLSWKPWTRPVRMPPEIVAIDRLAHGWEAENSAVTHLRDEYLVGMPHSSRESILYLLDRRIRAQRRRMTPLGGSDSHSHYLRAVTFLLAETRDVAGVRDAIAAGRTCIRSPWPCTLEARAPGGDWQRVGAALAADGAVEVRVGGPAPTILRDGRVVARPRAGEVVRVEAPPDRCTVLRAHVEGGDSAPIYVNCPFAG